MNQNFYLIEPNFFGSIDLIEERITKILDYIGGLTEAGDDIESIRYHLDQLEFIPLIDLWLSNSSFRQVVKNFLGSTDELFIKYIRYRSPPHKRGAQKFHRDWHKRPQSKRIEVFIALNNSLKSNGATEVIDINNRRVIPEILRGGLLAIDSSAMHRGRNNQSGEPRQIISFQLGAKLYEGEEYVYRFEFNQVKPL